MNSTRQVIEVTRHVAVRVSGPALELEEAVKQSLSVFPTLFTGTCDRNNAGQPRTLRNYEHYIILGI